MNKRQRKKSEKRYSERMTKMSDDFYRLMWRLKVDYLLQPLRDQDPFEARSIRHDLALYSALDMLHRKDLPVRQKRRLKK